MAELPFEFKSLPGNLSIPVQITSKFGERKHPLSGQTSDHRGLDIRATSGTPALAVFAGIVIRSGLLSTNYSTGCGEGILIGHYTDANTPGKVTYTTRYCHLQQGSTAGLPPGTAVNAGDRVGLVGNTGGSTAAHLHFELRRVLGYPDKDPDALLKITDTPIDPEPFIRALEKGPTDYLTAQVAEARVSVGGITPYIESLESFHPKIQYELTRRRVSAETANVYMPFVKLTSLSKVLSDNLPDGQPSAHCPSLGIHGQNTGSFDAIYLPKNNKSIIGYARAGANGETTVPVVVSDSTKDAANIPIPGITQLTVERGTAGPMGVRGGLMKADLKIVAYSVGQVDALLRYYLRPATRVVLELGRKSSSKKENEIKIFNWKQSESQIRDYFSTLIKSPQKQQEFIKEYIYDSYGNYEIFVAYVVKFNLKYNKNNTFEIDLTLHSVQQFEVPTKHTGVQSTCPSPTSACNAMDIQEYFSDAYSWKNNSFKQLMSHYQEDTLTADELYWQSQIIPIKNTDERNPHPTGGPSTAAGTRENEYFVSWNFFVQKILNDPRYGIASMLGNAELANLALLRVTDEPENIELDEGLIANQVGYHPNLRSVNPEVMIIWNSVAQALFERTPDASRFSTIINLASRDLNSENLVVDETVKEALESDILYNKITASSVPFSNIETGEGLRAGRSYLSRGIWLNTKSIKQAFTSTDTISAAISMLLNMMNAATEGYWNLQLYSTDVKNPGMHIIDMGLSKEPKIFSQSPTNGIDLEENESTNVLNSIEGINIRRYSGETEDKPKYIYMFNRGTKRFNDGELGSDLIDLTVEFNMPQVIAIQAIANIGGPAQKSTLQSINIEELREITLIDNLYKPCNDTNICSDERRCDSDEIEQLRIAVDKLKVAEAEAIANQGGGGYLTEAVLGRGPAPTRPAPANRAYREARTAREQKENELAIAEINQYNPNLVGTVREYADLGTAVKLVEINPSRMMKELNIDSTNAEEGRVPATTHAFNSSNLTKTVVEVTLPGIGGVNLFQSFLVDRIPSIIERGFYVVTKITHDFTSQAGWITKIQGRFRFRPEKNATRPYDVCPPRVTARTATVSTSETPIRTTPPPSINTTVSAFRTAPIQTQLGNPGVTFTDALNPLGR
jgi:hypothetical protein